MAHEVRLKIDTALVKKKDFTVEVKSSEGKIGTILISQGNIEWLPKGNSVNKYRFNWAQFAQFMEEKGRSVKKSS